MVLSNADTRVYVRLKECEVERGGWRKDSRLRKKADHLARGWQIRGEKGGRGRV